MKPIIKRDYNLPIEFAVYCITFFSLNSIGKLQSRFYNRFLFVWKKCPGHVDFKRESVEEEGGED